MGKFLNSSKYHLLDGDKHGWVKLPINKKKPWGLFLKLAWKIQMEHSQNYWTVLALINKTLGTILYQEVPLTSGSPISTIADLEQTMRTGRPREEQVHISRPRSFGGTDSWRRMTFYFLPSFLLFAEHLHFGSLKVKWIHGVSPLTTPQGLPRLSLWSGSPSARHRYSSTSSVIPLVPPSLPHHHRPRPMSEEREQFLWPKSVFGPDDCIFARWLFSIPRSHTPCPKHTKSRLSVLVLASEVVEACFSSEKWAQRYFLSDRSEGVGRRYVSAKAFLKKADQTMQIIILISITPSLWGHGRITHLELCLILPLKALKIKRTPTSVSFVVFAFFRLYCSARIWKNMSRINFLLSKCPKKNCSKSENVLAKFWISKCLCLPLSFSPSVCVCGFFKMWRFGIEMVIDL